MKENKGITDANLRFWFDEQAERIQLLRQLFRLLLFVVVMP